MIEVGQEFDSTWQWITWGVMALLFFVYNHYRMELRDYLFPNIATDRGRRQIFDITTFMGGMFVFLMIWGFVLESIYNS